MRGKSLPIVLAIVLSVLIAAGIFYSQSHKDGPSGVTKTELATPAGSGTLPNTAPSAMAASGISANPAVSGVSGSSGPVSNANPDLNIDANGMSKAVVVMKTEQGIIKYRFYPQDAPNTVKRIVELINQGFYNGLSFHRVEPGFVIQGGDPNGNGTGGSGQKIKAEFNNRHHVAGAVAMARASDPDSADSQFYVALGTLPNLDHEYTVFGQVIEGMDVAKKIKRGDKIISIVIE